MDWVHGRHGESLDYDDSRNDSYLGPTAFVSEGGCEVGLQRPQAFLAKFGARYGTLRTHFHPVDQFQYFVQGTGRFGGHDVRPGIVHYADRYQPYGPLKPDPEDGIAFLTLRTVTDWGAHYMPESRGELADLLRDSGDPVGDRLNLTVDLRAVEGGPEWTTVHEREDGMAMRVWRAPAGSTIEPVAVGGSGAYIVIVDGTVQDDGEVGESSLAWLSAASETAPIDVGSGGAVVALLQLPERSRRRAAA